MCILRAFYRAVRLTHKSKAVSNNPATTRYSRSLEDDLRRQRICEQEAENNPETVAYYRGVDAEKTGWPKKCNRTTNSPCAWSGTHWSLDKCDRCGYTFPEWN